MEAPGDRVGLAGPEDLLLAKDRAGDLADRHRAWKAGQVEAPNRALRAAKRVDPTNREDPAGLVVRLLIRVVAAGD
jgi:hypothetical protein